MTEEDNWKKNYLALKKTSFNVKFSLDGTDYDPIENIGSGAYGVVCSAVHKNTRKKVAIKKIPNIFDVTATAKRTYREIKILKHFKHDNVVAIREILQPPEQLELFKDVYVVLDLMESDLHRIIHSHQELSEEHVRYFLYQILRGIKYIHSASVIHRDLKPSNLLVNENCDLKIGDFGMARGVSSDPEEQDYNLTQYVATRWYRAPEIMLCVLSYSTAVDMWSIGCIFAEMLRRKHLFPGRDYINQLKLIIGTLGAPPREFLSQCQSPMLIDFVGALGESKPVLLSTLCPKASPQALDLLSKLLVIDPQKRLTAKEALKHPFLAKYHDPDDEPFCHPAFNFDFEQKYVDSDSLKGAIVTEIKEYSKPKPDVASSTVMDAVPKTVKKDTPLLKNNKSSNSKPLASGLEAFLQKMKESQAQLNQRMLPAQLPVTQAGEIKVDPPVSTKNMDVKKSSSEKPDFKQPNLLNVINTSSTSQTDVEMLSAKSQSMSMSDQSVLPSDGDIDSCKKDSDSNRTEVTDTKALIKAALLNSVRKKQEFAAESSGGKPRPVTAHQRMKEREDKRKEKIKRVMDKKKRKKKQDQEKEASSLMLTSDDKSLLERWKSMQQYTAPFVHPIRQHLGTYTADGNINLPTEGATTSSSLLNQSSQSQAMPSILLPQPSDTQHSNPIPGVSVPAPLIVISSQDRGDNLHVQPSSDYQPPYTEAVKTDSFSQINVTFSSSMSCQTSTTDVGFQHSLLEGLDFTTSHASNQSNMITPNTLTTGATNQHSEPDMVDLVTKQLSRHIGMHNYFPPALAVTPKGTGEGYGVGMDLDTLLNEALGDGGKKPNESAKLDSAPLSASLIRDWLDVSGNINLEALEQELLLKSPMVFT